MNPNLMLIVSAAIWIGALVLWVAAIVPPVLRLLS